MRDSARPFLKCAGGKTQLLPQLLAHVPKHFGAYHEPFVGGGALFFALRDRLFEGRAYLGDANPRLVHAYQRLRDDVEGVIARLREHAEQHSRDYYSAQRALDMYQQTNTEIAAWMIYLNKTCYNGLYRVNARGEFNVPFGKYKNPTICDETNLRACARALEGTVIRCADFRECEERVIANDLVYFDPPYLSEKPTAFTAYTSVKFGHADNLDLIDLATRLRDRGVHVILSNAGVKGMDKLWRGQGFHVDAAPARRAINSRGAGRGPVREYIISGGEQ